MIIAVDATGGDYAPHEMVKGAIEAIEEYKAALHELPDYQLAVESINRLRSCMN